VGGEATTPSSQPSDEMLLVSSYFCWDTGVNRPWHQLSKLLRVLRGPLSSFCLGSLSQSSRDICEAATCQSLSGYTGLLTASAHACGAPCSFQLRDVD